MSNQSWWAQKLGTQPAAPAQQPYVPQVQRPAQVPPMQNNTPPVVAPPMAETCPNCRSGNYGGTAETRKRCYDCGYPIVQSGSGMGRGIIGGQQTAGAPQPARQVQSGGWNPNVIVGKIE